MARITRRSFVATVGSATVVPAAALLAPAAPAAGAPLDASPHAPRGPASAASSAASAKTVYLFFGTAEASFIEAACERLIPADELGAGALDAGVPNYLDKQLAGAWGAGERLYRSGPWQAGTPSQGYQLPFTPAELFHTSLRAIIRDLDAQNSPFNGMSAENQDVYLKSLESGAHDLDGVPSAVFFDALLKMTVEGFFSDPVYGGNRNMVAWRMIGFPGAYADYFETVDRHGVKFEREPMSLAEDGKGHVHMRPNIPATL
ncbi:MAG: gluconate 2-dehydrogenase subunit 3 family protein [Pseudomonadota bacterium]|nr:gluconate 2-dehydrogenase subunit 3 family protein [Pseudomonadota bacterium]